MDQHSAREYFVGCDIGLGSVWSVVAASSPHEIAALYPEVQVLGEPPPDLTPDQVIALRQHVVPLHDAPTGGALAAAMKQRARPAPAHREDATEIPMPPELTDLLVRSRLAGDAWQALTPAERAGLSEFVSGAYLRRTRRYRARVVASRCEAGAEAVRAWMDANSVWARIYRNIGLRPGG